MKELIICIAAGVVLLVAVIIILAKLKKKKKRRLEMEQIARDKLREEQLDRMILNEKAEVDAIRASSEQPYQMWYSSAMNQDISGQQKTTGNKLMLQVEEIGLFSGRSYMLDPENGIRIGSDRDNTIILSGAEIEPRQCEITVDGINKKIVYIRNTGSTTRVGLIRGKKTAAVGGSPTQLKDGDEVAIADVRLRFSFVKAKNGGTK